MAGTSNGTRIHRISLVLTLIAMIGGGIYLFCLTQGDCRLNAQQIEAQKDEIEALKSKQDKMLEAMHSIDRKLGIVVYQLGARHESAPPL